MSEKLRGWRLPIGAVVLAVGLVACGGSAKGAPAQQTKPAATQSHPDIQVKYYGDGERELIMDNSNYSGTLRGGPVLNVFEFCDGNNLVAETEEFGNGSSSSIAMTANAQECVDGRLTPSDFPRTPDETPAQP